MSRRTMTLREGVSVRGVPAAEVNAFLMQPVVHVSVEVKDNGTLVGTITLDGDPIVHCAEVTRDNDGWYVLLSARSMGEWSNPVVLRPFGTRYPVAPCDSMGMAKFCRWLMSPRVGA